MRTAVYNRIETETSELEVKIKALEVFQSTAAFDMLDSTNRDLLTEQLNHMTNYLQVLKQRLDYNQDKLED